MTSTVERAFELAREGKCHSVDDIRQQLQRERYEAVNSHLSGGTITKQLRAAIAESKETKS